MNTNFVIKGAALVLTLGFASVASAQGTQGQNRPERQRGVQADSGRGGRGMRGRGGPEGMLLKGITLSESQKSRIAELGAAQRKQMEARRGQYGKQGQAADPRRQRPDSATMVARRAEGQKNREQHIAAIRAILDNNQRVQFDKNVAELKSRVGERGGERGQKSGQRDGQNFGRKGFSK